MQGNIDFSGTLRGSIAGGGGGGSEVTITPTLQSGTKIADYTIDETSGSLYAPTPESLTAQLPISISNGIISIDLSAYMTEQEIYTFFAEKSYVNNMFQSMSRDLQENYQKKLVAGTNITIDSMTNTISASGGSGVNYSTSEQDTGLLWTDGTSHVFQKTIEWSGSLGKNQSATLDSTIKFSDLIYFTIIEKEFSCSSTASGSLFSNYYTNTVGGGNIEIAINDAVGIYMENYSNFYIRNAVLTIRYVKNVTPTE